MIKLNVTNKPRKRTAVLLTKDMMDPKAERPEKVEVADIAPASVDKSDFKLVEASEIRTAKVGDFWLKDEGTGVEWFIPMKEFEKYYDVLIPGLAFPVRPGQGAAERKPVPMVGRNLVTNHRGKLVRPSTGKKK